MIINNHMVDIFISVNELTYFEIIIQSGNSAFYITIEISPFINLARRRSATEGGTQPSLLMHLDAVINAFCLSGNLACMHLVINVTARIRPFKL